MRENDIVCAPAASGATEPRMAASVDELVARHVWPGMHLHFAATLSRPNALIAAVARVFRGNGSLTVSMASVHSTAHALALSGAVRKMITCFLGDTYPTPRPCPLYQDVLDGRPYELELWSLLTFVQRLMAAGTGARGVLTSALLGTHLAEGKGDALAVRPDPWEPSGQLALLSPLRPDLTLVHGVCADTRGNVVVRPPHGEGAWSAFAAERGVLASVERIVEPEVIERHPDAVLIPGQRVVGLCEAPFGAHPQSLRADGIGGVAGYLDDYAFLADTTAACRDTAGARRWFDQWVDLPRGHTDYLDRLGLVTTDGRNSPRRAALDLAAAPPRPAPAPACAVGREPTRVEALIVLAARAVVQQVRDGGYDTLLAGIGASHMAAWLAARQLAADGVRVELVTELGCYGMTPCDGDVFLFSQRHTRTAQQLAGIPEALGGLVARNARCLGVLAAAEIDPDGDINTSVLPDGRWITGSGGAHDIASSADCVVVAAGGRRRYVRAVTAVTSSGHRVRAVVSDFGIFRREGDSDRDGGRRRGRRRGRFQLATFLSRDGGPVTPRDAVTNHTDWPVAHTGATAEKPITDTELALLRALDPEGHYR